MSSAVLANAQDFSKGMSYMQASTQATWHLNFLSVGIASGSSQAMLPGACSTVAVPSLEATAQIWPRYLLDNYTGSWGNEGSLGTAKIRRDSCAYEGHYLGFYRGAVEKILNVGPPTCMHNET